MSKINLEDVGQRIFNIRKEKKMTQEDFGKLIGNVERSLVSKWEQGKNLPNRQRIEKIAEEGHLTVKELLYGTEIEQNIRKKLKKWDDDSKEKIYNYTDNYLEKSSSLESNTISKSIELLEEYSDNQNFIGHFQTLTILLIKYKKDIEKASDTELKELKETFQGKMDTMIDSIKFKLDK